MGPRVEHALVGQPEPADAADTPRSARPPDSNRHRLDLAHVDAELLKRDG